jgi:hypothetical protein
MISNKKGQGEFSEYVITLLISTIVIMAVYLLLLSIYNLQLRGMIYDELKQLEIQTLDSIIKLYNTGSGYHNIENNTAILIGTVNLNYPPNVAKRSYKITLLSPNTIYSIVNNTENITSQVFSGAKIIGTTENPFVEVIIDVPNIDAVLQGSVSNGLNPILSFYKANFNGNIVNIITLGNSSLLATLTRISWQ